MERIKMSEVFLIIDWQTDKYWDSHYNAWTSNIHHADTYATYASAMQKVFELGKMKLATDYFKIVKLVKRSKNVEA